jgi:hypothetical protein
MHSEKVALCLEFTCCLRIAPTDDAQIRPPARVLFVRRGWPEIQEADKTLTGAHPLTR